MQTWEIDVSMYNDCVPWQHKIILNSHIWCFNQMCLKIWSERLVMYVKRKMEWIQATLVISTPDNSILSLISKWNESPNFFLYIGIAFRLWISQSMDNLKLWISQSGFSVPNCKLCMFILLLISKCKLSVTQNVMWHFEDYLFVKYSVGKVQN